MTKQVRIILFSCLYMLGILTFFSSNLMIISAAIFICACILMYKNIITPKYALVLCAIFTAGLINSFMHIKYTDDLTSLTDNNLTITAKVLSIPTNIDKNRTKFFAEVFSAQTENKKYENINAKTHITINDSEDKYKKIKIGDTLLLQGSLKTPQQAKNPSQFDYARYLQFKNTFSLFYVNNNWEIIKSADDTTGRILAKLNDTRNKILQIHAKNINSPMIEILGGIIFGDDAVNPDNDTKKSFINSGIFHILAASGMNVTLIFGIWFFFARNLRLNYKFSIFSGILLILFYTCMTGFGPPIIRAALMLSLILTGKLIDRKTPTLALLFMVAFLMLLFSPLMIFDIGFQLSFIVTFALIITAPLLTFNFKHKFYNYVLGACLIPVIAQFFAAPLQMYYFNTFTIYSVFANIAIIPVLSIVSFLGFISSILAMIPVIAEKVCLIADFILNPLLIYIVKVANLFSALPYSVIYLKKPHIIQILLYFITVIFLIIMLKYRLKARKYLLILFCLIIIQALTFLPVQNKNTEIIFFAVENADAILIKSPENKYFIIDSGKMPYKSYSSQAKNIIIKYLTDKGIKDIKAYIITHFDADHAGGTIDLVKNLNIERIYISDDYEDTKLSAKILEYFKTNNISPVTVKGTQKIFEENNFLIYAEKPSDNRLETENQKSIITSLKHGNKNVLFMGDGDIITYNALSSSFKENISVLKSGHHGAKNTINQDMIKNLKFTIISTGKNIYNHPNSETIKFLESNKQKYYRTDYHNAVKIVINEKEINSFLFSPLTKKFIKQ